MNKIKAIYTFYPIKDDDLILCDYEVGLLLLSILHWKDNFGHAHLITNDKGKEYFVEIGIDNLWDEIKIVDLELGDIDADIFSDVYRIKALEKEETPFCIMEYDTILKPDVSKTIFDGDVCLPYVEKVGEEKHAINNFIYFNNQDFLKKYIKECLTYMKDNSKDKDPSTKDKFFLNLGINRILLKLVNKKNVKVNYLFTKELNSDTSDESPFTELGKLETTTLFMLSRFHRESIRSMAKVYDSHKREWVEEYHPKRQYYLDKVRDMILIEQGMEWYEVFEDVVKNSPLVDNTHFQKGVFYKGDDGPAII